MKGKQIISRTPNGIVFKCGACDKIHVEYNNLVFAFTAKEYQVFSNYFKHLDADYWDGMNENTINRRNIIVPINHQNLQLAFLKKEILELKLLLKRRKQTNSQLQRTMHRSLVLELERN